MSEKFVEQVAKHLEKIRESLGLNYRQMGRATEGAPVHDLSWYGWEKRKLANVDMDHVQIALRRIVQALETPEAATLDALLTYVKTGKGFPWEAGAPAWREGRSPVVPLGRPRIHPKKVPGVRVLDAETEASIAKLPSQEILELAGLAGAALVEAQKKKIELPARALELIDRILSLLPKSKETAIMFMIAGFLGMSPGAVFDQIGGRLAHAGRRASTIDVVAGEPSERGKKKRRRA